MAEREVKIGLATFRRADAPDDTAIWGFALLGETVDVHKDDLERFDRLNGPAEPSVQPPLPAAVNDDPESDEDEESAAPKKRAARKSSTN